VRKREPPPFTAPFSPIQELVIVGLTFVQDQGPIEREYFKKGIVVEGVDE
jgi:hypothetical protein